MTVNWICFTTGVLFLELKVHALGKLNSSETIVNKTILVIFGEIEYVSNLKKYATHLFTTPL